MLNHIESVQLTKCQILEPNMRKPLIIRIRRFFTGPTIFVAILIFVFFMQHYVVTNSDMWTEDALPSAEDPNFFPKARSIFFHETFSSGLSIRQACAVEAAARAHPNREVYVLFSNPVTHYELKTGCLSDLLQFPNVKFLNVNAAEYSKGYVVQSMLMNNVPQSRFRIQHTADILRILTLNKWGGIYLDTDMIVTRSLDGLPLNFVAKETEADIASAVISFAKDEIGFNITSEIINEIGKGYDPLCWTEIGSNAIGRVLKGRCPKLWSTEEFRKKPFTNCKGMTIFDYELFYPQHYTDAYELFKLPPKNFDLNHPYTYHMYDFLSHYKKIGKGTLYDVIAQSFCPTIHSAYNDEFSAEEVSVTSSTVK